MAKPYIAGSYNKWLNPAARRNSVIPFSLEALGNNHVCADYGSGTLEGDTDMFVEDLLGG